MASNQNGWLFLNKPQGVSSRKALDICRRLFQIKKAGHVGTLDPLASGVLPIAFGEATKLISLLDGADKTYEFDVEWGRETETGDLEGKDIAQCNKRPSLSEINENLSVFIGEISQIPPAYSAIKVNGKRAYDLARQGQDVDLKPRKITIYDFQCLRHDPQMNKTSFCASCSKGTYIRSLAIDFAHRLGAKAVVTSLHRTKLANITEKMTISLDFLNKIGHDKQPFEFLNSVDCLLDDILAVILTEEEEKRLRFGQRIPLAQLSDKAFVKKQEEQREGDENVPLFAKSSNSLIGFIEVVEGCIKAKKLLNL